MNSKYYTPSIEEFHIGFEYEIYEDFDSLPKKDWRKQVYGKHGNNSEHLGYIDYNTVKNTRVKYLDQKDIEELGFDTKDEGECYTLQKDFDLYCLYSHNFGANVSNNYVIDKNQETLFIGTIKNKSELKKLLIQLGIKTND